MTLPRLLLIFSVILFGGIGIVAFVKKTDTDTPLSVEIPIEVQLAEDTELITPSSSTSSDFVDKSLSMLEIKPPLFNKLDSPSNSNLPEVDRIEEFFNVIGSKFPIVETITYVSTVPWLKGRPAWLSDYATHYQTSRHFIARSLNKKPDYLTQNLAKGDRFNVLSKDKNYEFYLLVDTSRCRLWFYYIDLDAKKKILVKTYPIALGRVDCSKSSGLLTPLGKYTLGDRIIAYKPKMMGTFQGKATEMITVFGTRWIPFDKEISGCTLPAKGFGIHGTPWVKNGSGVMVEDISSIGKYESDGCIRMTTASVEEIYAIVITKPTTIEIVRDFYESSLEKISQ